MACSFEEMRDRCVREGKLYEDEDFPATSDSIHPGMNYDLDKEWRRPKEIIHKPKFLVDGASRFDLVQGEMGDCWFIAAAAVLATKPKLFHKVVPPDQSFSKNYAGIFRFQFWQFGTWVDVIIDDRLPVNEERKLRFGHNRSQPQEFWGALLEKAYAKLFGSYEAIFSGLVRDALVDFTGGISETFNLRNEDKLPPDLWPIMQLSHSMESLMGCGIWGDVGATREEQMWNGLYKGHAYSITGLLETRVSGYIVKLIRVRNPWGEKEWTGAWSDGSDEWKSLSDKDRRHIGLQFEDEGEFWMSLDDFLKNFHGLDIVHLGPRAFARIQEDMDSRRSCTSPQPGEYRWQEVCHHGRWVKGVNAGGSGLLSTTKDIYYTNPQYSLRLRRPDIGDPSGECTCVISLMLKHHRRRRKDPSQKQKAIIGFDVHQVKQEGKPPLLTADTYFDKAVLKKQFQAGRSPLREISCRILLDPGLYCVIPNTLRTDMEGHFLLRIYTYARAESEPVVEDGPSAYHPPKPGENRPIGSVPSDLFCAYAGEDFTVDARDLRDVLAHLAKKEFRETMSFSIEACRSLITMIDTNEDGELDFDGVTKLWDEILFWRKLFKTYDKDKSGCIETHELARIFQDIGFKLSFDTLAGLAVRYGGKDRNLFFEDFVLCLTKTVTIYASFKEFSRDSPGQARLDLDQWLQVMTRI